MFFLQVTLNNYNFENVAFHVLHQRFPLYSQRTLSDWFDHNSDLFRFGLVNTSGFDQHQQFHIGFGLQKIMMSFLLIFLFDSKSDK